MISPVRLCTLLTAVVRRFASPAVSQFASRGRVVTALAERSKYYFAGGGRGLSRLGINVAKCGTQVLAQRLHRSSNSVGHAITLSVICLAAHDAVSLRSRCVPRSLAARCQEKWHQGEGRAPYRREIQMLRGTLEVPGLELVEKQRTERSPKNNNC